MPSLRLFNEVKSNSFSRSLSHTYTVGKDKIQVLKCLTNGRHEGVYSPEVSHYFLHSFKGAFQVKSGKLCLLLIWLHKRRGGSIHCGI